MSRHHRIDYIEISATDLGAAKTFYAAAFGWEFTDYGPGYSGIQGDEREQGGLCALEEGKSIQSQGPLVILFSSALDDTLTAVEGAGGTITTPPFDFPGGRRFHFRDPSGNELAVWTTTG